MAESSEKSPIPLAGILNWVNYFDENREELTKPSKYPESVKPEGISVDWEISAKVSLFFGDITRLNVDGIVNRIEGPLNFKAACDSAIGGAAGPELELELYIGLLGGCEAGKVITTEGYNLPAKYVVHMAEPKGEEASLWAKRFDSCLAEMDKYHMKSLAIPVDIPTNLGFAALLANVKAVLQRVRNFLENRKKMARLGDIDRIIFCRSNKYSIPAIRFNSWMPKYFPCGSEDEYVAWLTEKKERELEPLDGFIQVTTTEPDIVTFDDDPNIRRAKMPCGHVIGVESMTTYCKGILDSGGFVFKCPDPSCDAKWQYFLVRHVASLTSRQMREFEQRISQNYIQKEEEGTRECPQCHVMCRRKDVNDSSVQCILCTARTKQKFLFCWKCFGVWRGPHGARCGNIGCIEGDERIFMLAKCPIKRILDRFDAPSIRGCPKCGLLIEYLSHCIHMQCKGCNYCFCFLCLKGGAKNRDDLTCRPYNSTCTIAPRQTSLPGM